ncbi:MAG: hypothetical protein LBM21_00895 [Coriobacteriales bacterium]|jgi:hypothetical protein|nr:hypothetical protein [Coriobacteriales bacterium]
MQFDVRYAQTAFKHGINEKDILHAIKMCVHDGLMENANDVYLLIGIDTTARPLEIMYRKVGKNGMFVFHAMQCRKKYYKYLKGGLK